MVSSAAAQVLRSDSLALVAIYNSTGGDTWLDNSGWLNQPVENWYGVLVSAGRVIDLTLRSNGLIGQIPGQIEDLLALLHLDLYNNQLGGSIPWEIGNLRNLAFLSLANNQLTGPIPEQIWNITNLRVLFLNRNQLSGQISASLGGMTNLGSLSFSRNNFDGEIPSEVGELTGLVHLYFYGNDFTGVIPKEIGNLHYLRTLNLRFNALSGEIPQELGQLEHLEILYLGSNQLTGGIPKEFGNLHQLEELKVGDNPLSGTLPLELVNLTSLVRFIFSGTQLCRPVGPSFALWLQSIEIVFGTQCTNVNSETENTIPSKFELQGNFPNPFYSTTTIRYKLRTRSTVRFVLVNGLGELIQERTIGIQGPGVQSFQFDGQSLASGVYVYTISTSEYVQKGRMVIVK